MARPMPKLPKTHARHDADAHYNRGVALHKQGRVAEAESAYRAALAVSPDDKDALNNLSVALRQLGREGETYEILTQLVTLDPSNAAGHNNLGLAYLARGETQAAAASFARALKLAPSMVQAMNNLGSAHVALGNRVAAEARFREAIARDPNFADAHANLGNLLRIQGPLQDALVHNRLAAELAPNRKEMFEGLGQTLTLLGDHDGAIAALERAIALDPTYVEAEARLLGVLQHCCTWDGFAERRTALISHARARIAAKRDAGVEPHFALTVIDDPTFQREIAAARSRRIVREATALAVQSNLSSSHETPPVLRIGYATSHFSDAPTGHLVARLFETHDRTKVEVFGYALGRDDGSAYRRRIESACDRFADLHELSTTAAAQRIQADGIHVLVDLRGYAHGQRAHVLALRPAPVQVLHVGHPGTMAAPFIDYFIGDSTVIPAEHAGDFAEAVVTMPGSYIPTDDCQEIGVAPTRAECALPDDAVVYCCFNTNYKIEPVIFGAWMEVLRAVPRAVLWLIKSNDAAERHLRLAAHTQGIDPARLVFAPRLPKARHLARHVHADLFLDTHFVNAHTTAVDALWAGVPVLTWPGRSFVARVGASVVTAIDMEELIAADRQSYVAMAVALGRDRDAMQALKARLAENRRRPGLLFDTRCYAKHLEEAFSEMWRRLVAGLPPAPFAVAR